MQLKDFFSKKYIIFYLAVLAFLFLLIATLVIGFQAKDNNKITTLNTIGSEIRNYHDLGLSVPQRLMTTFGLLVSGLVFSGISLILLSVSLFEISKIGKYENALWWIGIILVLIAMILVLAGEGYYGNELTKAAKPLKFEDLFNVGRFAGLIVCITAFPLTTLILAGVWYPTMNKNQETGK